MFLCSEVSIDRGILRYMGGGGWAVMWAEPWWLQRVVGYIYVLSDLRVPAKESPAY